MVSENPVGQKLYLLSALVKDAKALANLETFIKASGATVAKGEDLGLKQLAYPINKHTELRLISIFLHAESQLVRKLNQELRHEEDVVRYLLTHWRGDIERVVHKREAFNRANRPEKTELEPTFATVGTATKDGKIK